MSRPFQLDSSGPDASAVNDSLLIHAMLSGALEGVIVTDAQGRIVWINPPAQRMIDYVGGYGSPEDVLKAWGPYLPDGVTPIPAADFPPLQAMRGELPGDGELWLRNAQAPDGLWVHVHARPIKDPNGALVGSVAMLQDLTQHRQLAKDLVDISGEEKRRIGQDLHDGVCQILTGLRFLCNALIGKLSAKESPEIADVVEIKKLVSQALLEADTVAKGLFPIQLESDGLVSALDDLTRKTSKLYHVSCRFLCDKLAYIENPEVSMHVYRIVQEALTNAIKHGHAKNIVVWLAPLGKRYALIVKDDGQGPVAVAQRRGMGWRIMTYRAERIGATLQFEASAGGGAALTCEFADWAKPKLSSRRRHDDPTSE
ncbi:MAG TPA: ATP-binding protein [Elusimicrobiota bacterium]|nr:ATP-binding protein [Elusimicrobiota bacterium]